MRAEGNGSCAYFDIAVRRAEELRLRPFRLDLGVVDRAMGVNRAFLQYRHSLLAGVCARQPDADSAHDRSPQRSRKTSTTLSV